MGQPGRNRHAEASSLVSAYDDWRIASAFCEQAVLPMFPLKHLILYVASLSEGRADCARTEARGASIV